MSIEIREHRPGRDIKDFVRFHHTLYANDPAWVAPLDMELMDRLSPGKNPFFEHAEVALFSAWKDGRMLGRISAQIDHEHLKLHDDGAAFFGFFDTVDDPEVAKALLARAEAWATERGMKVLRGPFSLSINEASGTLIEGFEHPPVVMMPHALPHQAGLAEQAGYDKAKDLFCWRYDVQKIPPRATRAWEAVDALPEVRFRSVDRSNMLSELEILLEIFNDAWSENWGFVPSTPAEVRKAAADMKLLIDPDLAFFAEIDGRPMGICVCLPNLNEATRDIHGKLFPFGFAKMLWRLKVKGPKSARLMLLGLRKELRGVKRYGALSTAMYVELTRRGVPKGYEWAELSWTLEDNRPINLGIRAMGGEIYKKYRIFEKALPQVNA